MDLRVLDSGLNQIDIIDNYISFIWTERYSECGDFELFSDVNAQMLKLLKVGKYLTIPDSDNVMVIEKFEINTSAEDGDRITIKGRTVDSILDRRIVWGLRTVSGSIDDVIRFLLSDNVISPSDEKRKIPNFIYKKSKDPEIEKIKVNTQFTGTNLIEAIQKLCSNEQVGFKVVINKDRKFEFSLFKGKDRTREQSDDDLVIFSEQFDNLVNSSYIDNYDNYKNVALIGGEGEGVDRLYSSVGDAIGLNRREMFVDARDISSKIESQVDGKTISMPIEDYKRLLNARGNEKLSETVKTEAFEGEVDIHGIYRYNEDYFIGDIVQLENRFGFSSRCLVTEYIISIDENGVNAYPTFTNLDNLRKEEL